MREGNCLVRSMEEIRAQLFPGWQGRLPPTLVPRGPIKRPTCGDALPEPR
jgi:hypothetical protein